MPILRFAPFTSIADVAAELAARLLIAIAFLLPMPAPNGHPSWHLAWSMLTELTAKTTTYGCFLLATYAFWRSRQHMIRGGNRLQKLTFFQQTVASSQFRSPDV